MDSVRWSDLEENKAIYILNDASSRVAASKSAYLSLDEDLNCSRGTLKSSLNSSDTPSIRARKGSSGNARHDVKTSLTPDLHSSAEVEEQFGFDPPNSSIYSPEHDVKHAAIKYSAHAQSGIHSRGPSDSGVAHTSQDWLQDGRPPPKTLSEMLHNFSQEEEGGPLIRSRNYVGMGTSTSMHRTTTAGPLRSETPSALAVSFADMESSFQRSSHTPLQGSSSRQHSQQGSSNSRQGFAVSFDEANLAHSDSCLDTKDVPQEHLINTPSVSQSVSGYEMTTGLTHAGNPSKLTVFSSVPALPSISKPASSHSGLPPLTRQPRSSAAGAPYTVDTCPSSGAAAPRHSSPGRVLTAFSSAGTVNHSGACTASQQAPHPPRRPLGMTSRDASPARGIVQQLEPRSTVLGLTSRDASPGRGGANVALRSLTPAEVVAAAVASLTANSGQDGDQAAAGQDALHAPFRDSSPARVPSRGIDAMLPEVGHSSGSGPEVGYSSGSGQRVSSFSPLRLSTHSTPLKALSSHQHRPSESGVYKGSPSHVNPSLAGRFSRDPSPTGFRPPAIPKAFEGRSYSRDPSPGHDGQDFATSSGNSHMSRQTSPAQLRGLVSLTSDPHHKNVSTEGPAHRPQPVSQHALPRAPPRPPAANVKPKVGRQPVQRLGDDLPQLAKTYVFIQPQEEFSMHSRNEV
ncbi:hypothetical protein CEUSTIGMA_g696.t1 [Chlamydomonas eustigma]|uniref:Uncharacterized protein n=1 Tax=Chlamydomonas eustigma TaxID=1157962 RepID=A0A250WRE3_9CHLO|nr:hypothetical protein CEUSTIGMA_g696.t1 [Chlamydomonas eustigma]|eukprot:GAX73242.1 hypothetical protein CEUSTIGMA_g696.t1 [Chlamydomonas eustigma]